MPKTVLIIGNVWPEPNSSAAGTRMLQLIRSFLKNSFAVTFASACSKSENAFDLNQINVNSEEIQLNDCGFDDFINQLKPEIVLFDRFMIEEQFGWRVAEQCPDALRILDTEDLHFLRKGRHQALKDKKPFDESYLFNETAKREIASILRSDLSLIISEAEMEILKNQFKIEDQLLFYLPFMLNKVTDRHIEYLPKFKERSDFITIGNFLHEPNYDAVYYLKHEIWPLIRKKLPMAKMHVYGAYPSQKAKQLHNEKDGFWIQGYTEDANRVVQNSKVCLAPLRFGAGLKGKLILAMQNGTPSVTTDIGAEGIYGNMEVNGFIENEAKQFAAKAVELYTNQDIWKEKQENGFKIIDQRFNIDQLQGRFFKMLKNLLSDVKKHRSKNFIGSMLHHHTMQSTKFMSKWIEEKNNKATR